MRAPRCLHLLIAAAVLAWSATVSPQAPAGPVRVKLAVWGDTRENKDNAVGQISGVLLQEITDWDVSVHTGDFTSTGSNADWLHSLAYPGLRQLFVAGRFLMCVGNHDAVVPTWDRYTANVLPTNPLDHTTHFYAWRKGNVHVVVLDEQFTPPARVTQWLTGYLASVRPDEWIVAVWHTPAYDGITYKAGSHSRVRPWLDVLDAHRAEFVLSGHAHVYLRTKPLRPDGTVDPVNGIVHIVNGTGGASWPAAQRANPMTAFTPAERSFPCIVFLTFEGNRVRLETVDARPASRRAVIDRWESTMRPRLGPVR